METKVCKRCGRELPLSEFTPVSFMPDGYLNKCKSCVNNDRYFGGTRFEPVGMPKKRPVKPVIKPRRGRPPKQTVMPRLGPILEPDDGKERRDRWIAEHLEKKGK